VRVIATDGSARKGQLVGLSATDVMLRRGEIVERVPLTQVRRLEAVTHRVRSGGVAHLARVPGLRVEDGDAQPAGPEAERNGRR
jgi:hypothetical protein